MNYEAFKRVPTYCGIWSKLKPINTDKWLRTLLHAYIDEDTKKRDADWAEGLSAASKAKRREMLAAGKAPLIPGEDYTPFASGVWVFGHVANKLAQSGDSATFAQPQDVIERLSSWWTADRQDGVIKAHHVVASFEPRIAEELHRRGYPVDAMLLASVHQTVAQFGARYYPETTLGWVAGCHHDRAHPHVHALIHPTTADGKLIRVSGLKDSEPGEDKFEYLRNNFNTRARQLFVGLTQQPQQPEDQQRRAARQFMLLSWHAMTTATPGSMDALSEAASTLNSWLGVKHFGTVVEEASQAAEAHYHMAVPLIPQSDQIRDRWNQTRDTWDAERSAHLKSALNAFRTIANQRKQSAYTPIQSRFAPATVPMESEYCAIASRSGHRQVTSVTESFSARKAESDRIRQEVNAAMKSYRSSIRSIQQKHDCTTMEIGVGAAHIGMRIAVAHRLPNPFSEVGANPGKPTARLVPAPALTAAFAEREMAGIAAIEASAHMPADPEARPSILASNHSLRFRPLAAPSMQLPDRAPTL